LFAGPSSSAISPLSLHDALPISAFHVQVRAALGVARIARLGELAPSPHDIARFDRDAAAFQMHIADLELAIAHPHGVAAIMVGRSEEHTSELQSRENLVCRLLLE